MHVLFGVNDLKVFLKHCCTTQVRHSEIGSINTLGWVIVVLVKTTDSIRSGSSGSEKKTGWKIYTEHSSVAV